MKTTISGTLVVLAVVLASCERNDPAPLKTPLVIPLRLELEDYKRELFFNDAGQLTTVKTFSFMPGDAVLESTTEFFYSSDGTLFKAVTDTGYRLEYSYEDGRIIRTDEYLDDVFSRYHTFSYDDRGRVDEFLTWQEVPEFGGVVPVGREIYVYDSRDNLSNQFLYYYNPAILGHELLTAFEYSDYDNHIEAERLFDGYAFNPGAVFRKNNPGKMVTKNKLGNTTLIDQYVYVYNERGYATRKTTTSLFPYNGSGGSYDTYYYYAER